MSEYEAARKALEAAGWFPERRVEVMSSEDALRGAGLRVWPGLMDFLGEFQGLRVAFTREGTIDSAWFDPTAAASPTLVPTIADYEERIGVGVAPIGYAYRDHLLLLLADDGRFFGGYDDHLTELGSSALEAIDALISGRGRRVRSRES
jgi:hypothetical protein